MKTLRGELQSLAGDVHAVLAIAPKSRKRAKAEASPAAQ
jgi:hypothetical protein